MISVTLNFHSIDAALRVLREIPENALTGTEIKEAAPAPKSQKAGKPAATPAAQAPEATTAPTAPATTASEFPSDPKPAVEASAPAAPAAPAASSVDYPTLQKAVFALAGKSREAAAAVASSFGVKTFKELDQAKWGDALAAVQAKIEELAA